MRRFFSNGSLLEVAVFPVASFISFVVASIFLVSVIRGSSPASKTEIGTGRQRVEALIPEVELGVIGAEEAKRRQLFWLNSPTGREDEGGAVRLLETPRIFHSLFPGYPAAMAQDQELWNVYFRRKFNPDSYLFGLGEASGLGFTVSYSWTGCFDVYAKYGADILVFGTSEVFRSLIPDPLSTTDRVLFCVTSNMPVETVKMTAEELRRRGGKKPKLVLWGYSFWTAYARSEKIREIQRQKVEEFSQYQASLKAPPFASLRKLYENWKDVRTASLFPKVGWNDFMPWNYQRPAHGGESSQSHTESSSSSSYGLEIDANLMRNEERVAAHLRGNLKPYVAALEGANRKDCDLALADQQLTAALSAISKISDHVYLYLTPTTPWQIDAAPDCFLPQVRSMLAAKAIEGRVHVKTSGMSEYQLTLLDFIRPTGSQSRVFFENNHTNYSGAIKVSEYIGSWVRREMASDLLKP